MAANQSSSHTTIHFFDSFDPEARRLLVHDLPLDGKGIALADQRHVHLIILGFGRMGRTLAVRAAQLGVFANGAKLKTSVIDRHADQHRDELLFRHPHASEVCDMEFRAIEATSPPEDSRPLASIRGWNRLEPKHEMRPEKDSTGFCA